MVLADFLLPEYHVTDPDPAKPIETDPDPKHRFRAQETFYFRMANPKKRFIDSPLVKFEIRVAKNQPKIKIMENFRKNQP